jgi:hypothetical protein
MSEPKASAEAYAAAATDVYVKLLPLRDRTAASEQRLRRILANAARDGHSAATIDETAFDRATLRLASRAAGADAPPPGIDGTPLGDIIAAHAQPAGDAP